ncbi:hypothetical protein KA478_02950 [Patescibacteria group bacterium]|nr:hypothetical protein [Patescibacteria group bacterium]
MAKFLLAHKNCRYAQLPLCFTDLNVIFDAEQSSSSGTKQEIMHKASEEIARQNLAVIKHSLEPYKVKDPYNPTPQEKHYIDAAFRLTQQYFP